MIEMKLKNDVFWSLVLLKEQIMAYQLVLIKENCRHSYLLDVIIHSICIV